MNKVKKLTQRQDGFTIIEVMIVLVIAAVILLIVFLAVPALQRNSRNTQRKNEVAALLAGANEYETNNDGKVPGYWNYAVSPGTIQKDSTTTAGSVPVKLSFYDGGTSGVVSVGPGSTGSNLAAVTDVAKVRLVTGAVCDTATAGAATVTGASSRQIVALYSVENGSTNGSSTCQAG